MDNCFTGRRDRSSQTPEKDVLYIIPAGPVGSVHSLGGASYLRVTSVHLFHLARVVCLFVCLFGVLRVVCRHVFEVISNFEEKMDYSTNLKLIFI